MKSWKTTLIGLGLGSGLFVLDALQNGASVKAALLSVGIAALGALAKDYDKTNAPNPAPTQKALEK